MSFLGAQLSPTRGKKPLKQLNDTISRDSSPRLLVTSTRLRPAAATYTEMWYSEAPMYLRSHLAHETLQTLKTCGTGWMG